MYPPLPPAVATAAVSAFLGLEGRLRQGNEARTLGAGYISTLRVRGRQPVVDSGPCSRVRHPGYAGSLLLWAGYALSWQTLPALLGAVPMVPAYARRIAVEEDMLGTALGAEYDRYRERTRRLVPGLY